jgi:hypothetical protein
VLLPPGALTDTQEHSSVRTRPSRCRRHRWSNPNRATYGTPCPGGAPGLTNDTNSLARDLVYISVTLGTPTMERASPVSSLLTPPPAVWGVSAPPTLHAMDQDAPVSPDLPLVGREEPVASWQDASMVGEGPSVFNHIPF